MPAARGARPGDRILAPLLAFALGACAPRPAASPQPVAVASIGPLADWARHVAGPAWRIECVLPPGASEHAYEIKPRDAVRFQDARLWIEVGAGLEPFLDRLRAATGGGEVFVLTEGLRLRDGNPHVWLDPRVARDALGRLAESFARALPADSSGFRARARADARSLDSLDAEYRAAAAGFRARRFIAFHGAWGYLASRYGLTQAGAIEESPGREPGPSDWARLIEEVRRSGAHAIYAEPQFGERVPAALARDAGVEVLVLDPIGTTGDPRGESYVALMRRNLAALERGLD